MTYETELLEQWQNWVDFGISTPEAWIVATMTLPPDDTHNFLDGGYGRADLIAAFLDSWYSATERSTQT